MRRVCENRHFAWSKIALLTWLLTPLKSSEGARAVFEACIGEAELKRLSSTEYLVWVDGDAMVLDHAIALTSFINGPVRHKALVIAEDMSWSDWLNTGVFIIRTDSLWARTLWAEVWECAHPRFHHAPFWDQSGFCQILARRRELLPDVLGAHRTGLIPTYSPWFSWCGGPRQKSTEHLQVLDAAKLQFANPLHAHFILHLCGYSEKNTLCREILRVGGLRRVCSAGIWSFDLPFVTSGNASSWKEASDFVRSSVDAGTIMSVGWSAPVPRAPPNCVRRIPLTAEHPTKFWNVSEPALLCEVPAQRNWSLAELQDSVGDVVLHIDDCAPLRANERPRSGRPHGCTMWCCLWQLCDYVRGLPPPVHGALGRLDPFRQWRCTRWALENTSNNPPKLPWDTLPFKDTLAIKQEVHIEPPGAETRLHRLISRTAIWMLEGEADFVAFPPAATELLGSSNGPPLFDSSQSAFDPWSDPFRAGVCVSTELRAGEVLIFPSGWWVSSIAKSALICVWGSWAPTPVSVIGNVSRETESGRVRALVSQRELSSVPWCKAVLHDGTGAHASGVLYTAVAHVDFITPSGKVFGTTRTRQPHNFDVGGRWSHSDVLVDALCSMAVGEVAYIALNGGDVKKLVRAPTRVVVLRIHLLSILEPENSTCDVELPGGWCWFGEVENWLGAPPGHEPEDRVDSARRQEILEVQHVINAHGSSITRHTRGWFAAVACHCTFAWARRDRRAATGMHGEPQGRSETHNAVALGARCCVQLRGV